MAESRGHGREAIEALGQPPRTGRFWFDFLAASTAIFISVVSLVVAIRGEHTQRELLAANSWPFVQLSEDQGLNVAKLDVENAGVGPAKIMSFEMFYKGLPVDTPFDLLRQCCSLPAALPQKPALVEGFAFGEVFNNVLRPGEHIISLRLGKATQPPEMFDRFKHAMADLTFRVCYCSVLGECWQSNLRDLAQAPLQSCPIPKHQFSEEEGS